MEGKKPLGPANGLDVLLWLFAWPWALMRFIGRKRRWTPCGANWAGVGATVGLILAVIAVAAMLNTPQGAALRGENCLVFYETGHNCGQQARDYCDSQAAMVREMDSPDGDPLVNDSVRRIKDNCADVGYYFASAGGN